MNLGCPRSYNKKDIKICIFRFHEHILSKFVYLLLEKAKEFKAIKVHSNNDKVSLMNRRLYSFIKNL